MNLRIIDLLELTHSGDDQISLIAMHHCKSVIDILLITNGGIIQ